MILYTKSAHCKHCVICFAMGNAPTPAPPPPIRTLHATTFAQLWLEVSHDKNQVPLQDAFLLLAQAARLAGKTIPDSELRKWLAANHSPCTAGVAHRRSSLVRRDDAGHLFDAFTSEYGIPCEPIPGTPEANDAETAIKSADLLAEALLTRCLASFLRDDKLYALGAGDLHAYAAAERTRQPLCSYLATLPIDVTRLVRTAAR